MPLDGAERQQKNAHVPSETGREALRLSVSFSDPETTVVPYRDATVIT
jgi:hypothetical protein